MARRQKYVAYGDEAKRDAGKTFLLTELPASEVEDWAQYLYLAMAQQNVEIPEGVASLGAQGLAIVGLKALHGLHIEDVRYLSKKMMDCVQFVIDPTGMAPNPRKLVEEDIEEVETRLWLKNEVFELHVGFSLADAGLMWASANSKKKPLSPSDTPTSPEQLQQSSEADSQLSTN